MTARPNDLSTINLDDEYPYCGYSDLFPMGMKLIEQASVGSYQGDTMAIFMDEATGKLAFMQFGWGSCGGCDWLQSILDGRDDKVELRKQLQDLADGLFNGLVWKDTKDEMIALLKERDEGNSYWLNEDGGREALNSLIAAVEAW